MEKAIGQVLWSRLDFKKHRTPSAKRRFEKRKAERENPNLVIKNDKPVEDVCLSSLNFISSASNAVKLDKQREIENVYKLKQEILKREEAVARREIEYKKKMNELWFEKEKMSLRKEDDSTRDQLPKMTTKFWKTPAPIDGIPKRKSWLDDERYNKKLFVEKSKQIAVEDLFEEPQVFNYSPEQSVPWKVGSSLEKMIEDRKKVSDIMTPIVGGILQLPEISKYGDEKERATKKLKISEYRERDQERNRDPGSRRAVILRNEDMTKEHRSQLARQGQDLFRARLCGETEEVAMSPIGDAIEMSYNPNDLD